MLIAANHLVRRGLITDWASGAKRQPLTMVIECQQTPLAGLLRTRTTCVHALEKGPFGLSKPRIDRFAFQSQDCKHAFMHPAQRLFCRKPQQRLVAQRKFPHG